MSIWRFRISRPGNGRRLTTAAFAAACGILGAGTSSGQAVERSDLERCAAMQSDEMKLACYELLTSPDTRTVEPDAAASIDAPASEAAASPAGVAGTASAGAAVSADVPATAAAASPAEVNGTASAGAGEPAESSAAPRGDAADELGSEQVKAQTDAPLALQVTIAKVTRDRLDRLYFHFDNGQVWRQIEPRRFRYPDSGEFQAIVSTGMTGEFRLRISEDEPMTRIRRVK